MVRHTPVKATPMAFVHSILLAYKAYDMDPSGALAKARIAPSQLDKPEARITASQFEALSDFAMRELDDEALGWFSRRLPWGSYGLLCRASLSSPNLGVALKRWCRHFHLLTDDLTLRFSADANCATLQLDERRDFGPMREFCLVSNLRYVLGYSRWVIDSHIALTSTHLAFDPPAHADLYDILFPGTTEFNAATTHVSFSRHYLDLPLRRDETSLRTMLKRALPLTIRPYRRDRMIVSRVRALLQSAPFCRHTAESISNHLNVSIRTLHRQLQVEGTTFQQIKDDVRFQIATRLLGTSTKPIKQIAHATGFQNDKSFSRAFKLRIGQTPDEYRNNNKS